MQQAQTHWSSVAKHGAEIKAGKRFEFGKNWEAFLTVLDQDRIDEAVNSLKQMLDFDTLEGKSFLDIGSGSGLFSLAARILGAKVHSFDFDPNSVACTNELRRRYFNDDPNWIVNQGSVLDDNYLAQLGRFDVVYSWGVLHHTGEMWRAIENASKAVAPNGLLFIAIYNWQHYWTGISTRMKHLYVRSPAVGKYAILLAFSALQISKGLVKDIVLLRNPLSRYRTRRFRGMSPWYNWIDWVGGYPFETAKPEGIFYFLQSRGFTLLKLKTAGGGHGCNEFVFRNHG